MGEQCSFDTMKQHLGGWEQQKQQHSIKNADKSTGVSMPDQRSDRFLSSRNISTAAAVSSTSMADTMSTEVSALVQEKE